PPWCAPGRIRTCDTRFRRAFSAATLPASMCQAVQVSPMFAPVTYCGLLARIGPLADCLRTMRTELEGDLRRPPERKKAPAPAPQRRGARAGVCAGSAEVDRTAPL